MIQIGGFKIEEQIYESVNSRIFRGKRISDETPVIIKKISQEYHLFQLIYRKIQFVSLKSYIFL